MKTIFCMLFYVSIVQSVCSQNYSILENRVAEKYAITLTPAFFPFDKIGIQPGFQFKVSNHLSLMTEIAIPIAGAQNHNGNYDETRFLETTSELKIFRRNSPIGRFGSVQLGYIRRNFTDRDSGWYHSKDDTTMTGYARLSIKSPVFFCAVKMGGEIVQWKKVFMDFFIGIGIRIIPTKYDAEGVYIKGRWNSREDFVFLEIPPAWEYNKTSIRPHFSLGFRIGRKF